MKTLTGLNASKTILDPVHGSIPITELELKLISTPVFQRLRNISQLSSVSLVYPGATHNRFQHSLGSLYIMDHFMYTLKINEEFSKINDKLNDSEINNIIEKMRLSALLHDCGHLPFSHTFESRYKQENNIGHEQFGGFLISKSEIGEILKKNQINPDTIGRIIQGVVPMKEEYSHIFEVLVPLMHSDADADRMDYLLRDSYYTGVPFGKIDILRICDNLTIQQDRICFNENTQDSLEDFLYSRFLMYKRVANHKTAICFDLIYQKLYEFIDKYKEKIDLPFVLPTSDEIKKGDRKWFENQFCSLNELDFFKSIKKLLNDVLVVSNSDRLILENLNTRILRRESIKLSFIYDNLNKIEEIKEKGKFGEICSKEKILFDELSQYPGITDHWSFLRHDPSHPLEIVSSFNKNIDDEQDPDQIQIYINKTNEVVPLQSRSNSIINMLATHHRIFIAYYHDDSDSRKIIKEKASKFLPAINYHVESKKNAVSKKKENT